MLLIRKDREKWMTPDKWAKLIDHFPSPQLAFRFDGEALVYAVGRTTWTVNAVETTNYTDERLTCSEKSTFQRNA
jgi:hypothetical protein